MSPIELFYSYAHKDEALREELEKHLSLLKRQGYITTWHDRRIIAGQEWASEIDAYLNTAKLILLLVSPDFMASDYCYDVEVRRAVERHQQREAFVIPIILRSVDWQDAPFGKLQALPKDAKPIKSWTDQDEAFLSVATGIRKAVEEITRRSSPFQSSDIVTDTKASQDKGMLNQAKSLSSHTLGPQPLFQGFARKSYAKYSDKIDFTIDFTVVEHHRIEFFIRKESLHWKHILFLDGEEIGRKRVSWFEHAWLGDLGHYVKFESKFLINGLQASFFFKGNNSPKFHIKFMLNDLVVYEGSG